MRNCDGGSKILPIVGVFTGRAEGGKEIYGMGGTVQRKGRTGF